MNVPVDHLLEVARQLEKTGTDCRVRIDYLRGLVKSLNEDWQSPAGHAFIRECHGAFHTMETTLVLPEVMASQLSSLAQRFTEIPS